MLLITEHLSSPSLNNTTLIVNPTNTSFTEGFSTLSSSAAVLAVPGSAVPWVWLHLPIELSLFLEFLCVGSASLRQEYQHTLCSMSMCLVPLSVSCPSFRSFPADVVKGTSFQTGSALTAVLDSSFGAQFLPQRDKGPP